MYIFTFNVNRLSHSFNVANRCNVLAHLISTNGHRLVIQQQQQVE